jgi:5-methylcytosine-specific restriction enzyme subunit McrC
MQNQYGKDSIHSHNFYQIQAYVNNYDVGHTGKVDGMLLYAKTQEEVVPDGKSTFRDGNVIFFKTLDLNTDFDSIRRRLDSFVMKEI